MYRLFITVMVLVLLISAGAAMHAPDETITAEGTVDSDEYRYYLDADKVGYPAMYTREEVDGELVQQAIYKNMSVEKFAAMKASDVAADALEKHLRSELGVQQMTRIGIGTTGHDTHHFAVDAAYREPADDSNDTGLSEAAIREAAPDAVTVDITFVNQTRTVSIPVTTSTTQIEQLDGDGGFAVDEEAGTGAARQEGGASDGTAWQVNVEKTNATCASGNTTDMIRDVSYNDTQEMKTVRFAGTLTAGTPCHDVSATDIEQDGNVYTLNVTTEDHDGICVQCVGALTYEAEFTANQPFRLEILHNGKHVDAIEHPAYEPEPAKGVVERILDWFRGLF